MGALSGCQVLAWALVALLLAQKTEAQGSMEQSWESQEAIMDAQQVTFIPPVTIFPTMSPLNAAHSGRVCSTWGDFHYKTFDGDVFRFPGLCNYIFSAHCGAAYEDFNLQLRRGLVGSRPTITHIVLKVQGLVLEVSNGSVLVNGQRTELPYSRAGLLVEQSSTYVKINTQLMLTFMWNGEDSALLELDPKYANQTCGLCGDFNGLPAVSEFYAHNARLTPLQFGNLQKLDGPTEQCQDPLPSPADNCTDEEGICRRTLLGPAFAQCHRLVDAEVYVAACTQDLCRCPTCPCATFAEYSRQCAHARGQPQNWRGPDLCSQTCPLNTQHQECGSPCVDTCSNPERSQLCEDHCVDGCFCPPGTVLDDITDLGCLPLWQCPCTHGGHTYAPGASFTTSCSSCTCFGGRWQCQDLPCPGTCSVQGGSHISTYDEKLYDLHGDCSYVLTKKCADNSLTVLAELRKCGLTDNENCLKTLTLALSGGHTAVQIQANGAVFVNSIYTQLPVAVANVTIFRPTSFFVLVQTGLGLQLQVQLVPLMQAFLRLDPAYHGQMCGLCGNFNQNQADDFRTISGVVEGTAAAFANTWKTQAACPNVKNSFEDPCSLSVENENYAQHWCSLLTDPAGAFSSCHSVVSPGPFHSNCLFDTCNCEKSEDCMCAALSSYVRACAAQGVLLRGWRDGVCDKYVSSCPKTQSYAYVVDACQPTCRSLSQADVTCDVVFVPVDGCTCPSGTFLDDAGDCVAAEACPCYSRGSVVAPGEVLHDNGVVCSCVSGKLSCLGAVEQSTGCAAPMVFLNCSNAPVDTPGAECVRSCHMLDVDCFSTHCVSGCVCPAGLLSDGSGGCVAEEDCPCLHNEAAYKPGETIRVDCNTCTCRGRRWECSQQPCLGTCVAYGDGHFITFDGERYSFEGSCEYTLAQDYCVGNDAANGTFRIVTENVPCGTTGVTCSKAIKIFLENYELILHEGTYKVLQRGPGGHLPYRIRYMGIYLAIETRSGMVVSWDRKTSVFIRLHQEYKGRVCGLCGNFDDNGLNDFTTRSQSVVGDVLEFGNSWKFSPSCPDAQAPKDPCTANPYRKSWAQKQCSLIHGAAFSACRSQVDPTRYYEACVSDACACDAGGDCECFCTAVAAYAQACHEVGVCVSWRTPDICPLFCDYYNPHGECEWHYQPCGAPCLRTCRNPSGRCLMDLPGLEGCYPRCPPSKPFFNEDQMKCVARCSGCYDEDGNYYDVGSRVPTAQNCQSCDCTSSGLQCTYSPAACTCTYEGRTYTYGDVIYNTTDGLGACLIAICRDNGTIVRRAVECPGTPSTTPFTFTSTAAPPSTTGSVSTPSTVCVRKNCLWSDWYDSGRPELGLEGGDFETFENLRQRGYQVCPAPADVQCRAQEFPHIPLEVLGQKVECGRARGLICLNSEQSPPLCNNYQLKVLCCNYVPCSSSPAPSTSQWLSTQPLSTSTQTTPTRGTTLPMTTTTASTLQTPSTAPATTVTRVGSSSVAPTTTTCEPHCQWTEWFDEDYPKYEEAGGDVESYDKIRRAGGDVCEQPRDIQCRAKHLPSRRLEGLSQRVHCDVNFGLVCRNAEQVGRFKMCYNYEIRVLCCGSSHCRQPTTPSTTSTATTATTSPTATATTATTSSATISTATATTPTTPTPTATTPTPSATAPTATTSTATIATVATSTATIPTATTSTATTTIPTATAPTATAPTATTSTATVPTATTSTATAPTATVTTATTSTATIPTATISTATTPIPTATVPTATTSTATAPTATATTATTSTATISTATATTPTTPTPTATTPTPSATAPTATTSTATTPITSATAPSATASTATTSTATTSTATTSTATTPIPSATAPTATAPTATTSTATIPTATTSTATTPIPTATATTATTSTATISTATTSTATTPILTATTSTATAPTASTASSTTTTAVPPTTQPRTQPGSTEVTRSPTSSATPVPSLSTGLTARVTSLSPSHTGTLLTSATGGLTSPPGSTESTIPGTATSVLPTRTTSWGSTLASATTRTSKAHPPTGTAVSTVGTASTSLPPTSHPETSTPGTLVPTTTTGATTSQGTTSCQPKCQWTEWFDVDFPTSGVKGGDMETYDNIRAAGGKMCQQPQKIECRAESYPEVSIDQIGQVLSCSLEAGLVCRNEHQRGQFTMCFNYNIRVYCCDDVRHCPTMATPLLTSTTPPTTSSPTATESRPSTSATTQTRPTSTTMPTTGGPTPTESRPSTSATTQTPPTSTTPPATGGSSTMVPKSSITTVTQTGATSKAPLTAPIHQSTFGTGIPSTAMTPTTRATTYTHSLSPTATSRVTELPTRPIKTTPTSPIPISSKSQATSSTGPGTRASLSTPLPEPSTLSLGTTLAPSTATSTATVSSQKTHISSPTSVPTYSPSKSTTCQPLCAWTDWLDHTYPKPGASGGDFETYANIQAAGGAICQRPLYLECRAEALPNKTLQELGQVVRCQLEEGLVCRNQDQRGLLCLNYQIRVFCCDHSHCLTTPSPTSTMPAPSPSTISTSTGSLSSTATSQTHLSSPRTTGMPIPTNGTGPFSTGTTQRSPTPITVTGPSSTETTGRGSTPMPVTGPSSLRTTQSVSTSTPVTSPSSSEITKRVSTPTPVTGPSTMGTTGRVSTPTPVTGPSSTRTTETVSTTTTVTGPSSTGTTQRVSTSTPVTGASSTGTTETVSTTTTVTGPSSTGTTQRVSTTTPVTGAFSTRTTQTVSTPRPVTGPFSTGTTRRGSTSTPVTGPSSTGTTETVSTTTTVTGPSSTGTTQRVSTSTPVTGPSSTGTTETVSTTTPVTGPSSMGTTETVSTPTPVTGPFSTRTTETVSTTTTVTGPSSTGTTQRVSTSTPLTGPSSTGTTETVSIPNPVTGASSTGTTQRVSTSTPVTGASSTGTTETVSIPTPVTGPSTTGTTQRVSTSTPATGASSTRTTETVSTTTTVTGPSSTGTTQRVSTSTPVTGPSSTGTTKTVSTTTPVTGPSSTRTTETVSTTTTVTGPSSTGTTQRVSTTTPVTGAFSTRTTQTVSTPMPVTGPFSMGTTRRGSTSTPVTGPSSTETTQRVSTSTPVTGPSSTGTTETVSTPMPVTGASSTGTTEMVSTPTPVTGPFSTRTTETVSTTTTVTGPSSIGNTQRVSTSTPATGASSTRTTETVSTTTTVTGPSSTGTTQRVSTSTPVTGPSSTGTTETVSTTTTVTGPSSTGTTQRVSISTPVTGASSTGTTQRVSTSTPLTGPSSTGTTETVSTTTTVTGPSSTGTTQRVSISTPVTGASSTGTTQRVSTSTPVTGPSSTGTTETVSTTTPVTGPSSTGTTETVSTPTPVTGPFSTRTTETVTTTTTVTGPSSTGTTQRVSTSTPVTGPSSTGTTETVSIPTPVTGPSSTGTTQRFSTSTPVTGASSTGTTQRVSTSTPVTGPSSTGTTETVSIPTPVTGPSSTGTTQRVSTSTPVTGASSTGTTETVSIPTPVTGPSSMGTTQRVSTSTPVTGPSSTRTTETVSTTTPVTGPSSTGTTEMVSTPTPVTGPFSTGTTQRVSTSTPVTGPSSTGTTETVSIPTPVTGPSTTGTTETVSTTTPVTGPFSTRTTETVSTTTTVTGPSSTGTTQRVSTSTPLTGPSSTGTTETVSIPNPVTGASSTGTTQRVSTSTPVTGPSSTGTTETVSTTTPVTGPSSTGTTETVSTPTPVTGPFSTRTTETVTTTTTVTGPSSTGTTETVSIPTPVTGPSSTGTTQRVSTSTPVTGASSTGTTQRVSTSTPVTGPSSTGTTETVSIPTPVTGPFSTGTTQRVSTSTPVTGPSSTGTTETASIPTPVTGPSSTGTTQRVSTSTPVTGPSSTGTTETVSTTTPVTGPSSTGTTQRVSTSTPATGASSTRTTETVSTPTLVTGPSSMETTSSTGPGTRASLSTPLPEPSTLSLGTTLAPSTATSTATVSSQKTHISSPTSVLTYSLSKSTTCQPLCAWTDWLDHTYPMPGASGGDFETYANIQAAGGAICQRPLYLECRAEALPNKTLQELGQVVRCRLEEGLVCRNQDQRGLLCLNYQIRVFCCDRSHCLTTPSPTSTTPAPSLSTISTSTGSLSSTATSQTHLSSPRTSGTPIPTRGTGPSSSGSTKWVSTPTETSGSLGTSPVSTTSSSPTTSCYCHAFGNFYLPGEIIYDKIDRAGCQFLAICNQLCDIDRFQGACSTPSSPGTSASTSPTTPVTTPVTTLVPGCYHTTPPRQVNESWTMKDCTVVRCEGNNRVVLLGPRPQESVVCVNGHLPVKVQGGDGPCDYRYECECSCSGWGDAHYETFDGTSYSFLDNCTHVLMREISPRHGNLSVLLHSRYCRAATSCRRALSVHYEAMDIVLTTTGADGQEESLILFGHMSVGQGFSKNGLTVRVTGATGMSVEIPAIGVSIAFNGRVFQARLSYSHFSYNTEGQCGTCTNNRRDDCRRPDGTMAPTCQDMARSWLVPSSSGEGCWAPTGLPPTTSPSSLVPSTPTSTLCPPDPLCKLLLSPVFAGCHGLIPPGPFFSTCVLDSCSRPEGLCQSLEAYALLCRARGVCPDWRNATSGLCDLTCPPTKVYKPCGPVEPESCDSRSQSLASGGLVEGCFCPDSHILFNSHTDVCVPQCRKHRHVWAPEPALQICNTSTCPQSSVKCGPREQPTCIQAEDGRCPPSPAVNLWAPQPCLYNGTTYGVGATFPAVISCHTCTCLSVDAQSPTVQCKKNACNTTCPQGFQYSRVAGQCCGECVQTACLTPDGRLVQPNETWVNSLVDNCTEYHCQAENGPPLLTPTPVACPDVSGCRGILRKSGCCYSCEPLDSCQVRANLTVLHHRGCATQAAVSVPFCEGFCPGVSRYSMETQATQCQCICCRETKTHQEVVTMQCPDGTAFQHTYTHVDACSCGPSCLSSPQAPEDSTPVSQIYGSTKV
ncbi:mucin-5B-like [Hippopotamus amphibius kiboko]|uniref:mucin-5B-like n=1 Tax=Hippopotamus amphibius kiboko TaxID=575201 RepID=UPI002591E9B2|nr:mucin-5B-like [Hippopotamus amphibius kiboko]